MLSSIKKFSLLAGFLLIIMIMVSPALKNSPSSSLNLANLFESISAPNFSQKLKNYFFQKKYYYVEDGPKYKKLIFKNADFLQVVQKDNSMWVSGKINFPASFDENSSMKNSYITQRFFQRIPSLEGINPDDLKIVSLPNEMIIQFPKTVVMSI